MDRQVRTDELRGFDFPNSLAAIESHFQKRNKIPRYHRAQLQLLLKPRSGRSENKEEKKNTNSFGSKSFVLALVNNQKSINCLTVPSPRCSRTTRHQQDKTNTLSRLQFELKRSHVISPTGASSSEYPSAVLFQIAYQQVAYPTIIKPSNGIKSREQVARTPALQPDSISPQALRYTRQTDFIPRRDSPHCSPCLSPDTASAKPSPIRLTLKLPSSLATTTATTASARLVPPTVRPIRHKILTIGFSDCTDSFCSPRRRRPQGQADHQRPRQEVDWHWLIRQKRPPSLLLRVRLSHCPRPRCRP
jgi:hypothetical protein